MQQNLGQTDTEISQEMDNQDMVLFSKVLSSRQQSQKKAQLSSFNCSNRSMTSDNDVQITQPSENIEKKSKKSAKLQKRIKTNIKAKRTSRSIKQKAQKYSKSEDEIIENYVKLYGKKWSELSKILTGKDPISIKNRYYSQRKHQQLAQAKIEKQRANMANPISQNQMERDSLMKELVGLSSKEDALKYLQNDFVDACIIKDEQIASTNKLSIFEDPDLINELSASDNTNQNSSITNLNNNGSSSIQDTPSLTTTQEKQSSSQSNIQPENQSEGYLNYAEIMRQINQLSCKISLIEQLQAQTKLQLFIELQNLKR